MINRDSIIWERTDVTPLSQILFGRAMVGGSILLLSGEVITNSCRVAESTDSLEDVEADRWRPDSALFSTGADEESEAREKED